MDGVVAGFADHQRFSVQGNHCQHPTRDVFTALMVLLLDVPKFTDVMHFKLIRRIRLVTAEFTRIGVESIKNLVAQWKYDV